MSQHELQKFRSVEEFHQLYFAEADSQLDYVPPPSRQQPWPDKADVARQLAADFAQSVASRADS